MLMSRLIRKGAAVGSILCTVQCVVIIRRQEKVTAARESVRPSCGMCCCLLTTTATRHRHPPPPATATFRLRHTRNTIRHLPPPMTYAVLSLSHTGPNATTRGLVKAAGPVSVAPSIHTQDGKSRRIV